MEPAIQDYLNTTMPVKEILATHRVNRQSFYNELRRRGIGKRRGPYRQQRPEKSWDDRYFSVLDCPDKAYWLGFLFADGCVQGAFTGDAPNRLKVDLAVRDKEHVVALANALGLPASAVKEYDSRTSYGLCRVARLVVNSRQMTSDLVGHGCIPNKTKTDLRLPPSLPEGLVPHFIRGYLDGDGSVTTNGQAGKFVFTGPATLLEGFQKAAAKALDRPFGQKLDEGKGTPMLHVGGKDQFDEVARWLYGGSGVCLERKRKAVLAQSPCLATDIE